MIPLKLKKHRKKICTIIKPVCSTSLCVEFSSNLLLAASMYKKTNKMAMCNSQFFLMQCLKITHKSETSDTKNSQVIFSSRLDSLSFLLFTIHWKSAQLRKLLLVFVTNELLCQLIVMWRLHLFLHHARSSHRLEQPATDDDSDITQHTN